MPLSGKKIMLVLCSFFIIGLILTLFQFFLGHREGFQWNRWRWKNDEPVVQGDGGHDDDGNDNSDDDESGDDDDSGDNDDDNDDDDDGGDNDDDDELCLAAAARPNSSLAAP